MANMSKYKKALREAYGIEPTSVHGVVTVRSEFYRTQLRRIAFGLIEIDYNQELYSWDKDYFKEALLLKGLVGVTQDNHGILLPLKCGATGVNVFNRPTEIIVANPVIGSFQRTIGRDCEIIYLESLQGSRYRNLQPIINMYATKLANCDGAIDVGIFNSKTTYIFQAPNNTVADSFKAMFDNIAQGDPAVFVDEQLGNMLVNGDESNFFQIKAKENYVVDLVQNEKHEIMNEFLTAIGINNANMSKREREIVDEVNSNNISIRANIKIWTENVAECLERVNKMYPDLNLTIKFPYYEESKQLDESSVDRTEEVGDNNEPN